MPSRKMFEVRKYDVYSDFSRIAGGLRRIDFLVETIEKTIKKKYLKGKNLTTESIEDTEISLQIRVAF
ncbi:MAG: hypothetical protein AB1393_03315 [Candidatus Edwardsbacteria bacterium]